MTHLPPTILPHIPHRTYYLYWTYKIPIPILFTWWCCEAVRHSVEQQGQLQAGQGFRSGPGLRQPRQTGTWWKPGPTTTGGATSTRSPAVRLASANIFPAWWDEREKADWLLLWGDCLQDILLEISISARAFSSPADKGQDRSGQPGNIWNISDNLQPQPP